MRPDSTDIVNHASFLILDRVPLDEMAGGMTASMMGVRPTPAVEGGGRKIVFEQIGDNLVGKQLHAAIRMMNDEPFTRAEQFVRDDQRPYRVVGGAAAGIANHMRVPFGEASVFCRIEPGVHAGEDRELSGWRQGKFAFRSEVSNIGFVRSDDLINNL